MKIVYAERARQDIAEIFDFISPYSTATAKRVEAMIRATCERLAEFPYIAAETDEPGVRRLPLVRYPYAIFYRVNPVLDRVEIVRVIHAARITDLGRVPDAD
jgi:plasmid stabilization system protein ParE